MQPSLKLSGNIPSVTVSLKSLCKTLTVASELEFSIFGGSLIEYRLMTLVQI